MWVRWWRLRARWEKGLVHLGSGKMCGHSYLLSWGSRQLCGRLDWRMSVGDGRTEGVY